jgi:hypothetical protein
MSIHGVHIHANAWGSCPHLVSMSMPSVHVHERVLAQYVSMSMSISESPGIEPGCVIFPSHKNNVQFIVGRTATM